MRWAPASSARSPAEIRQFLVSSVSATGGHLGSNLGVVELTIALHRVFSSPDDAIVWDTGHQAYVHKLVTGRQDGFAGLRQRGGMSGYPNRAESEHDLVENSHASTALSYAYGLATAAAAAAGPAPRRRGRRRRRADRRCRLRGTQQHRGLGRERRHSPQRQRALLRPDGVEDLVRGPVGGPRLRRDEARTQGLRRRATSSRPWVSATSARWTATTSTRSNEALQRAADRPGPVVLHVHTTKGRGYRPAELDEEKCLHDVGPFDPETGLALRRHRAAQLHRGVRRGARARGGGCTPSSWPSPPPCRDRRACIEFRDRYPERFFDVGIAEQHAVNAAAGMAMGGLRPVVAIYSTFLNRAWDQVYYDVGLHRLPVVFCLDRAGITGDDGPSHHGVLDMMLLTKVPGMTVLAPSSYEEVGNMLHEALQITSGPVALRWPKSEARSRPQVGSGLRAHRLRAGSGVCLIGVGKLVSACEQAAQILALKGIEATVWDARVATPLDAAMLADALAHDLVVTAEDGIIEGGVGSRIIASIRRAAPAGVGPAAVNCGVPTAYLAHGAASDILTRLGLDGPSLSRVVLDRL